MLCLGCARLCARLSALSMRLVSLISASLFRLCSPVIALITRPPSPFLATPLRRGSGFQCPRLISISRVMRGDMASRLAICLKPIPSPYIAITSLAFCQAGDASCPFDNLAPVLFMASLYHYTAPIARPYIAPGFRSHSSLD